VWPLDTHQEDVTPEQQVEDMAVMAAAGYTAFKTRIWRRDPSRLCLEDVRMVKLFKARLPHCQIMLD
jgi:L-alanine-DL-glutamate epimerase-like enolase superfamily enzyme